MDMKMLHKVAYTLLWVGGVNWGLVGLWNVDLVQAVLGGMPALAKLVYVLVGVSAVYTAMTHMNYCMYCSESMKKGKRK
jgi:uncharacterized membrane protein YuzA (DUF378 family)